MSCVAVVGTVWESKLYAFAGSLGSLMRASHGSSIRRGAMLDGGGSNDDAEADDHRLLPTRTAEEPADSPPLSSHFDLLDLDTHAHDERAADLLDNAPDDDGVVGESFVIDTEIMSETEIREEENLFSKCCYQYGSPRGTERGEVLESEAQEQGEALRDGIVYVGLG